MTSEKTESKELVHCTVKNCQKLISISDAIKINGKYYCKICGVAKTKSIINFFGE